MKFPNHLKLTTNPNLSSILLRPNWSLPEDCGQPVAWQGVPNVSYKGCTGIKLEGGGGHLVLRCALGPGPGGGAEETAPGPALLRAARTPFGDVSPEGPRCASQASALGEGLSGLRAQEGLASP